ncbi:VOC family protein [Tsukamurella ocularis]|uniref:VOC family protein n=1 Tax=Tsukamurella ocularis TaxID=1970234 RepID=UPI002168860B|nr:VOC family protein [Tsukamurella ocularis]MCS3778692.1 hypothetical protein [Tsukamurella ocularis]MCS3789393.1 hypothetical protein [Tsukamurella ocularis]MCS3851375.1 hypothetical protein [Tsukamurella ocularis]
MAPPRFRQLVVDAADARRSAEFYRALLDLEYLPGDDELAEHHRRVLELGGTLVDDGLHDPEDPLRVYADLDGHPFCIFVAEQ